jgi:anti-sigma regulatory factor (Ser/Thr protein kinase)
MILEPLTVPGELDAVTQLMDFVAWSAAAAGLDEQATYKLCLAVDEIATNIVTYSYMKAGRRGDLVIAAETDPTTLRIHLTDEGAPFDPRQAPPPADLDRPLSERRDGGLGIFLALWGVDAFDYEPRGDTNRSTFIVRRPTDA